MQDDCEALIHCWATGPLHIGLLKNALPASDCYWSWYVAKQGPRLQYVGSTVSPLVLYSIDCDIIVKQIWNSIKMYCAILMDFKSLKTQFCSKPLKWCSCLLWFVAFVLLSFSASLCCWFINWCKWFIFFKVIYRSKTSKLTMGSRRQ